MQDDSSHMTLVLAALSLAAASNNDGATCLDNGDMQKAYECFKSALDIINGAELSLLLNPPPPSPVVQYQQQHNASIEQQCLYQQQQQQQLFQQHQPQHVPQEGFPIKGLQQYALLTQHSEALLQGNTSSWFKLPNNSSAKTNTSFQNSPFFVYKKAFLFAPDPAAITRENISFYKSKVMFNLATTIHQGGNCVDESSVYKALNLYDLCLECSMICMTPGAAVSSSSIDRDDSLMLTIAALNNKAHVFYEFCEFPSLQIILDTLFLAMTLLPKGVQPKESQEIQGVLFNVYMLRDLSCARAA